MSDSIFCPQCGRSSVAGSNFCSTCGAAMQVALPVNHTPRVVRPRSPRMLAGVCSGVAIYFGWDIALVRILFTVFVCITSGLGALAYLLAWVLIPEAQYALPASTQRQGNLV